MSALSPEEQAAAAQQILEAEARVRAAVAEMPPHMQLNTIFSAYWNLATAMHGKRAVAQGLMQVGGSVLMAELMVSPNARCSVPAPGAAEYHEPPSTLQ